MLLMVLPAIPYPSFRYLSDALGDRPIITPALPVVESSALHQQAASPANTDMISFKQEMHRLARLSRPQNFRLNTS
ncbi:hypothetical protein [Lonsdalea quercina]|uniref:hypothetical protein n=1 Tax=Lonsdalea quercina TaxID=71657 RepID=UPI003F44B583